MKKFKNLMLICLIFISIFSFTGCKTTKAQATPNITDADVIEVIQLDLDLNKITGTDNTGVSNVKNEIRMVAKIICDEMNAKLNNKINMQLLSENTTEETENVLLSYRNGIKFSDLNFKLDGSVVRYEFCVKYKDVNLYKYYYDEKGEESQTVDLGGNFFYNKVRIVGDETSLKHREFSEKCEIGLKIYFDNIIKDYKDYMVFNLHATKHRLKSNSDFQEKISMDNYLHTWIIKEDAENEVEYYYNIANRQNWIVLSIGITLVIGVILFVISINIKENKKQKINENKLINKIILKYNKN